MDRLWNSLAGIKTDLINLADYNATGLIRRLNGRPVHPKVEQRILLERSEIPINEQIYLLWSERHQLEQLIECLDHWPNVGINTLLMHQNALGRTPLIKALPIWEMRNQWMLKLATLDQLVTEFNRESKPSGAGLADNDVIRCFPSPVNDLNYLGITMFVEAYRMDMETPGRMPFIAEVGANYPRYMHNAEIGKFLSLSVDKNGKETIAVKSEDRFAEVVPKLKRFIREYALQIKRLADMAGADLLGLELEYLPPDWLRVFDFNGVSISTASKLLAEMS